MLYRKNVGRGERIVRLVGGGLMIACGMTGLRGTVFGYILIASGIVTMLTGTLGYCPGCALVGKRPEQNNASR